jgi:hypothetical protein
MDTILATPWRRFEILPEDNFVLMELRKILSLSGMDVMREVRNLYRRPA